MRVGLILGSENSTDFVMTSATLSGYPVCSDSSLTAVANIVYVGIDAHDFIGTETPLGLGSGCPYIFYLYPHHSP